MGMLTTSWSTRCNGNCTRGFVKLLLCVQLAHAASRREATLHDREQHSLLLGGFLRGSHLKSRTELCVEPAWLSCGSAHAALAVTARGSPAPCPGVPVPGVMCTAGQGCGCGLKVSREMYQVRTWSLRDLRSSHQECPCWRNCHI